MDFWLKFFGIMVFVLLEGFFSGSEIAIISCDRLRLKHLSRSGHRLARIIEKFLEHPQRLFSITLVGTNLCVVTGSSLMAGLLAANLGPTRGPLMATFIMTPVILIFGEIIPKTIFRQAADFLVPTIVLPLMIFYFLLSPIIFVAAAVTNCSLALLKEKKLKKTTFVSREEIAQFIEEGGQKSFLEEEKFKIIKRIFDFEGRPVAAIMVPFEQVVLLPADRTVAETLEATRNFKFSRFPVFEGERSAIVGFLEIKDLLAAEKNKSINSFLKPLLVVPAYKKIEEMLEDFISEKAQIARVVNESGQTTGIVTREDLIEEILGEIKDEFDR